MSHILQPILKNDLLNYTPLIFDNILIGFNNFPNGILCAKNNSLSLCEKENLFINFFNDLFDNSMNIFTDYYVNNLNEDGIKIIKNNLNTCDFNILKANINNNSDYFKIPNKTVINYITKLSTRELCFCTIYTDTKPISIWGNYNFKFPIFFSDRSLIDYYLKLANTHGLVIDSVTYPN